MIGKIMNKLKERKMRGYLDLTTSNYLNDKKWQYIPFKIVSRPYHRWALVFAGSMALTSLILPCDFGLGAYAGFKFLGKYG